jgi:hypothetical protein
MEDEAPASGSETEERPSQQRAAKWQTIRLRTKPAVVIDDIPGLGKVEMREITLGARRDIGQLVQESSTPAHTFAVELARSAIIDPILTSAQVENLPAEAWDHLAPALANVTEIGEWYAALRDDMDCQERLYQADKDRWEQWTRELRVSLQPAIQEITAGMPTIQAAARQMLQMRSQIEALVTSIGKAHLGLAGLIADVSRGLASVNVVAVDSALFRSGINSALIHTPSYVPPRLALPGAVVIAPPSPALAERQRMLNAYDVLVRFEQAMRQFIAYRLGEIAGPSWWKQRVPESVRANCHLSRAAATLGEDKPLIEYAHVGEYRDIILRADNWREVFQRVFRSKAQVEACFEWCTAARVEIGHSRPLPNDLWTAFNFAARWLIAAIES